MRSRSGCGREAVCDARRGWYGGAVLLLLVTVLVGSGWAATRVPGAWAGTEAKRTAAPLAETPITPWANDQIKPRAAYSPAADRYLVVWEYAYSASDHDIHARQVGSDGTPLGDWRIGVATAVSNQSDPDAACHLTSGECLVVWEHEQSATNHDIHAYRISGAGTLLGVELSVAASGLHERRPAVAYNAMSHEYLVVYERRIVADELDYYVIYGQRVGADGAIVGAPIAIADAVREHLHPAVEAGTDYLVVWQERQQFTSDYGIYGQRVATNGSLLGGTIAISTWEGDQVLPRLAYDGQYHNFLVVWEDHHWGVAIGWDIYGQLVSEAGTLDGSHLMISGSGEENRARPDVAHSPLNRSYMVAWDVEWRAFDRDVYVRRVAFDGSQPEAEAALTISSGDEWNPAVAQGSAFSDKLLVVWEDDRDSATQGENVYGTLWTMTVPKLSGHVYSGDKHDTSTPHAGVTVELYCSSGTGALGTLVRTATSDAQGFYSLGVARQCEVYHLLEIDPEGYVSTGATSTGGTAVSSHQITYVHPLQGKELTGNNFWDAPQGPVDSLPPGNWTAPAPPGWVNSWTPDCSVQVEDGGTGLDPATAQYAFSVDGGATWHGPEPAACTGEAGRTDPQTISASSVPFGQDSGAASLNRVRFYVADVVGNPGQSPVYPVLIDTVPPQNPTITCPQHPVATWSSNSQVTCQWLGATDDQSGVGGYSLDWDHAAFTLPALPMETADTEATVPLSDSAGWYWHVRSVDEAGNGAPGAAHYGPIQIDTSPPSAWLTEPNSGAANFHTFYVSWSGSDGPSGVASYDVQTSPDGVTWTDWKMGVTSQTEPFTGERGQVVHFRVRARDQAGNVGEWSGTRQVEIGVTLTVRVENEYGATLSGAEVFRNGSLAGSTFGSGTIQVHHVLYQDELAARYLVHHHAASKAWHDWLYGSPHGWSYRIYQTSVDFDDMGYPQMHTVTNTATTQVLRVRRDNPLVGFYVLASVEWDADEAVLSKLLAGFESASAYLFDLTDGQMMFQVIDIWDSAARWNDADIRIHASNQIRSNADPGGIGGGQDKHVYTPRFARGPKVEGWPERDWDHADAFRTLVHEWGHYGLYLYDEYLTADGNVGGRCTVDRHKTDDEAERASAMDYQFTTTELCSSLSLHPHNSNTMQHAENGGPCWDTLIDRYDDASSPSAWLLEQPPDRGSIMVGPTSIPVAGWINTRVVNADGGACPPIETEWVYEHDGSPAIGFDTWVDRGYQLYQGKTVTNATHTAGAITILGARPGDTVRVHKDTGWGNSHSGSWTVACPGEAAAGGALPAALQISEDAFTLAVGARLQGDGTTLEVGAEASTELVAPPEVTLWQAGAAEPLTLTMALGNGVYTGTAALDPALDQRGQVFALASDTGGHQVSVLVPFAIERVSDQEMTWAKSEDGRMDLFLPAGSLPGEPAVGILPSSQMGEPPDDLVLVAGPYEVSVSSGVYTLAEPARVNITYDPAPVEGLNEARLRIQHWDGSAGLWIDDGGAVDLERHIVSAQVGQLGTFAVLEDSSVPVYLPLVIRAG